MTPITTSLERLHALAEVAPGARAQRLLVIVNPYATTMSDRLKHLVVYALKGRFEVDAVDTRRPQHATEICRAAAGEGYDAVVAFGGDGTVNEVANGLIGTDTALACLPGGATNVYCRILGIPNDVVDATEHLLALADRWEPRLVDVGTLNGRAFTFSAGAGLDADVVRRVDAHPQLKRRWGVWGFTAYAVATFLRDYVAGRAPRLEVEADGVLLHGVSAFVQNADPYTYFRRRPIRVGEGATLDSGGLAGAVLERANPLDAPSVIWRLLAERGRVAGHRHVQAFTDAEEVVVRSIDGRAVDLHVDGDHIGAAAEAVFRARPRALRVVA